MVSAARLLISGLAISLIGASGAQAATRTVTAGAPPAAQERFGATSTDVNDFFPHRTTIRVGDRVRFIPAGFHDVTIPQSGGQGYPLFLPTGSKADAADAAGAPFWFNGQDVLGFNPTLLEQGWGKRFNYNGSTTVSSGVPLADRVEPLVVRFRRTGTVRYLCDVHPGMTGVVRVRGRNAARPSNRAHRRALNRQVQRDLGIAADLPGTTVPTGQIVAGPAGPRGVEHLAFVPGQATVAVGSTLTFTMDPDTREVHTATVGPGNIEDPASYLGSIAASFQAPVTDPRAVYPSSPPPEIVGISPTAHGNGYANTGLIDNNPDTPAPTAATVRFDAAGTYSFYCLIHPFMLATVVAQE